jgi:hypothetical protein
MVRNVHISIFSPLIVSHSQVVYTVELLEIIIAQSYDPDDFGASEHMYNLRLVSRTFMQLVMRVVLHSIRVRWGLEKQSLGGLYPQDVSDGRPIFSPKGVMQKLSLEERRLVKEVYFETHDVSFGRTGYPYDGDRCYLVHFMQGFCNEIGSSVHLVICPAEHWDWVILAEITQPLERLENIKVTWLLHPLFLLCYPPTSVWADRPFHLIPIHPDDNPDLLSSLDIPPPAAPQRIIFSRVQDDRDIIWAIKATQNHLRAIEAFWHLSDMLNLQLPYLSEHPPPTQALARIESIVWVIQADTSTHHDDTTIGPGGSPTPGVSCVRRMGDYVQSRVRALQTILSCFAPENQLRSLVLRLHLGLPYGQGPECRWIVQKVELALEELTGVLVGGFRSLDLVIDISLRPGREHHRSWSILDVCEDEGLVPEYPYRDVRLETETQFYAFEGKFRRTLAGFHRTLWWRLSSSEKPRSIPRTLRQQEEVLSKCAGNWDLRVYRSPSRWEVSRAFLERRVNGVLKPMFAVDAGWTAQEDAWNSQNS